MALAWTESSLWSYGYNWKQLNKSFRRSSASGNWLDVAKVCRVGLCRALYPQSHLLAVPWCGFRGLLNLPLQVQVACGAVLCLFPLCYAFLGFFCVCQSGHLCKQPVLSAQPLQAKGGYAKIPFRHVLEDALMHLTRHAHKDKESYTVAQWGGRKHTHFFKQQVQTEKKGLTSIVSWTVLEGFESICTVDPFFCVQARSQKFKIKQIPTWEKTRRVWDLHQHETAFWNHKLIKC